MVRLLSTHFLIAVCRFSVFPLPVLCHLYLFVSSASVLRDPSLIVRSRLFLPLLFVLFIFSQVVRYCLSPVPSLTVLCPVSFCALFVVDPFYLLGMSVVCRLRDGRTSEKLC